ncbi:MAG: adenylyl cyclase, partial [Chloroflexi bacterium]|nr:adenylyl cyclase [Chloroflexota bacterium]
MVQVRSMSIRLLTLLLALTLSATNGTVTASATQLDRLPAQSQPDFGPNVIIFDPSMPVSQIQATFDTIHAQQVND